MEVVAVGVVGREGVEPLVEATLVANLPEPFRGVHTNHCQAGRETIHMLLVDAAGVEDGVESVVEFRGDHPVVLGLGLLGDLVGQSDGHVHIGVVEEPVVVVIKQLQLDDLGQGLGKLNTRLVLFVGREQLAELVLCLDDLFLAGRLTLVDVGLELLDRCRERAVDRLPLLGTEELGEGARVTLFGCLPDRGGGDRNIVCHRSDGARGLLGERIGAGDRSSSGEHECRQHPHRGGAGKAWCDSIEHAYSVRRDADAKASVGGVKGPVLLSISADARRRGERPGKREANPMVSGVAQCAARTGPDTGLTNEPIKSCPRCGDSLPAHSMWRHRERDFPGPATAQ